MLQIPEHLKIRIRRHTADRRRPTESLSGSFPTNRILHVPTMQMAPISTAPAGETKSQPAVTPTSPASTPFSVSDNDGFPNLNQLTTKAKKPPAHADKFVVRNTCEIAVWSVPVEAANCEPGLNPNQPNHKINTPRQANVRLWPGIAFDFPSLPYFPKRGPKMAAPTKAIHPPTE